MKFKAYSHIVTRNIQFLCLPPFSYPQLSLPCHIHSMPLFSPALIFTQCPYFLWVLVLLPLKGGVGPQCGKCYSCSPNVFWILLPSGAGALLFLEAVPLWFMLFYLAERLIKLYDNTINWEIETVIANTEQAFIMC